jgi:hypothetical protein
MTININISESDVSIELPTRQCQANDEGFDKFGNPIEAEIDPTECDP